ncbi:MAG: hypothetical protein K0R67_3168, partial [Paenibacillus sp.]|nr:hypothetical protein [Paenibacillus sp.]
MNPFFRFWPYSISYHIKLPSGLADKSILEADGRTKESEGIEDRK